MRAALGTMRAQRVQGVAPFSSPPHLPGLICAHHPGLLSTAGIFTEPPISVLPLAKTPWRVISVEGKGVQTHEHPASNAISSVLFGPTFLGRQISPASHLLG